MNERILQSKFIQSDTTSMPVIKKGLGKTHKGTIWIRRGDNSAPYILYDFTETCHGADAERLLAGFEGILLTDGASIYNGVIRGGAIGTQIQHDMATVDWQHVNTAPLESPSGRPQEI